MPLAPLKVEREPLRLSSEVVCYAVLAPERVFSWGGKSVHIRLFQTLSRLSLDITTVVHLIHDSNLSCTNTMATDFKNKINKQTNRQKKTEKRIIKDN